MDTRMRNEVSEGYVIVEICGNLTIFYVYNVKLD